MTVKPIDEEDITNNWIEINQDINEARLKGG